MRSHSRDPEGPDMSDIEGPYGVYLAEVELRIAALSDQTKDLEHRFDELSEDLAVLDDQWFILVEVLAQNRRY